MAAPTESRSDYLRSLRPVDLIQPLHNSIPKELLPRFDPVYVEYYNKNNAGRLHTHEVPIEEYRKNPAEYATSYGRAAGPDIYRITEQKCPVEGGEITVRIFEPAPIQNADGTSKKRAAYINFHGGGWVFGDLSKDHDFCKGIVDALEGDLVAFDVDYRLAPEHQYPIPVDDCWAAFNWVSTSFLTINGSHELTASRSALKKRKNSISIPTGSQSGGYLLAGIFLL
jgi:acetyl esterase/lipase